MQPMPVLDRMLRVGGRSVPPDDIVQAWSAVKFRSDAASDMYWYSQKEYWHRERDYPPMRLPFPAVWIEWNQPYEWNSAGKVIRAQGQILEYGPPLAALLTEVEIPENRKLKLSLLGSAPEVVHFPESVANAFSMAPYALRDGRLITFPAAAIVMTDESGMQIKEPTYCIPGDPEDARATMNLIHSLWAPALLAIGLLNCKNVSTAEGSSLIGPRVRRSNPKRDEIQYHTIVVPGHHSGGISAKGDGESHLAMHRVRGHFKTFTAEAPLLGQHVGTYWWGWQVRGSKENGVVVADYKIGQTA